MASADTSRSSRFAPPSSASGQRAGGGLATALLFILLSTVLASVSIWLQQAGFKDDLTLSLWSKIIVIRDAPETRLEYLGVVFPHLPAYLLMLLRMLPGLDSPILPYLVSNVMIAGVLTHWSRTLVQRTPALNLAIAMLFILAHPYTLWTATTSVQRAIGFALFYALSLQFARLTEEDDSPQVFLKIGALLAVMFFADERAFYLVAALVPLLVFVMPRELLARSPASFFLILLTPFALAFGTWAYVNWLFFADPLLFLHVPDSAFLGARSELPYTPWLRNFGGEVVQPFLVSIGFAVVAFPAFFLLIARAAQTGLHQRIGVVIILVPIVATALATFHQTLGHPSVMFTLLLASLLVGILLLRARSQPSRYLATALLGIGVIGGWITFGWQPTAAMTEWTNALYQGRTGSNRHLPAEALGNWLASNRRPTLIDDSGTYGAIVARGDARGLVLPYSMAYKLALRSRTPDIEQIVVADPASGAGTRDAITQRFRALYDNGMPGYQRVYDGAPWRVYRRVDAGS